MCKGWQLKYSQSLAWAQPGIPAGRSAEQAIATAAARGDRRGILPGMGSLGCLAVQSSGYGSSSFRCSGVISVRVKLNASGRDSCT